MQRIGAAIVIVGFFGTALCARAQMTSPSYEIRWDTIGNGGDDTSSSPSYILRDTTGNTGIGQSTSASYDLAAGYRSGVDDQIIEFSYLAQDNASARTATAVAGSTITCSCDGLSVDDLIALVQDQGEDQVSAIGRITSVGAGTITVDEFVTGGVAPVIDGSGDVVYVLSDANIDLESLNSSEVTTSIVGMEVTADVDGGYVIQIMDDGDLRDGAETITDVADGTVTAGSEEYGARSSDTTIVDSTFDSSDSALTTTFQDITTQSGVQFDDRSFLTLKAAISSSTTNGNYSHSLTLIISGNY